MVVTQTATALGDENATEASEPDLKVTIVGAFQSTTKNEPIRSELAPVLDLVLNPQDGKVDELLSSHFTRLESVFRRLD